MSKPLTCQQCFDICLLNDDFDCDGEVELDWGKGELAECLGEINTDYNQHHDNCKIKNLDNE